MSEYNFKSLTLLIYGKRTEPRKYFNGTLTIEDGIAYIVEDNTPNRERILTNFDISLITKKEEKT